MIGGDATAITAYGTPPAYNGRRRLPLLRRAVPSCAATELLIRSLTLRAWEFTERDHRHTLQQRDLLAATMSSNKYDFLIDITNATVETSAMPTK